MKTFLQPLTAREEREYLRQYKEGDREARNVLISRNMRLVAHVIKKYQSLDEDPEDLLSSSYSIYPYSYLQLSDKPLRMSFQIRVTTTNLVIHNDHTIIIVCNIV